MDDHRERNRGGEVDRAQAAERSPESNGVPDQGGMTGTMKHPGSLRVQEDGLVGFFSFEQNRRTRGQCSTRVTITHGERIVKQLIALGVVAILLASSATGQGLQKPATPAFVRANTETRYLAFQIFTYGPDPRMASMGKNLTCN